MKITKIILFAAWLFCALVAGAGEFHPKKEYRMQVNVGPSTYWGMGAQKFADLAREKTDGLINVKPYFGSQLLKGAQLNSAQMVAMGGIDLALESTINTAPVIPGMNIFSLPFFVNTYENVDRMEKGQTGRLLFAAMQDKGLMPLAWGENGFRQITNSRHAIRRPEDLKGMKIRVVGSPVFIDIFRSFGADPINMNWGDAVTAFQQGTVDGQENPVAILLAVQIHQYHKYVTLWNYLIDPLILYWNKRQWEAFPPELREKLQSAATEAAAYQKALVRAGLDGGESLHLLKERFHKEVDIPDPVGYLEKEGMIVTTLSEEEKKAFRDATRSVSEKWIKKLGPDIVAAAQADVK